ncbi:MAG: hypothetical protein ACBR50_16035 [Microcoleus sp.]
MCPQRAIALIVLSSARSNNEMMEWSIDFHNPQGMNISSNSPYTCWGLGRSTIIFLAYLIDEKKL